MLGFRDLLLVWTRGETNLDGDRLVPFLREQGRLPLRRVFLLTYHDRTAAIRKRAVRKTG